MGTSTPALAAGASAPPLPPPAQSSQQVQPVPYAQSQPVPYAQAQPTAPAPAPAMGAAQYAPGNDVVVLKSGGMVRGTLIEIIPNDHATVQLATGQNAIIQWDHIHHIERGAAAAAPAARAPAAEEAPVASARVHIETDRPVTLERRDGHSWEFACTAPCDADMPIDKEYRISGPSVRSSGGFHLSARSGEHVTLDINAGTRAGFAGGIVFVSLGPITMLVGAVMVAAANAQNSFDQSLSASGVTSTQNSASPTAGWIVVAVGAAATLGGILMIAGNARTSVEQHPSTTRPNDAWLRAPTWREEHGTSPSPKTMAIPILSGSF